MPKYITVIREIRRRHCNFVDYIFQYIATHCLIYFSTLQLTVYFSAEMLIMETEYLDITSSTLSALLRQ